MSAPANPYQPPAVDLGHGFSGGMKVSDAVEIRQAHLNHEAAVRSIGILYYLSAFIFLSMIGVGILAAGEDPESMPVLVGMGLVLGPLFAWLGRAVRRLDRRARIPVGLLSAIGLINAPVGTLVNGYILYLVFGEKGKMVFSDEYQRVRAQTPEIRYETPGGVKLGLALIILLVGVASISLLQMD